MIKNDLELTICSVYHSQLSRKLLELNRDFTKQLNPNQNFIWIAVDNTPEGIVDRLKDKFSIVRGIKFSEISGFIPKGMEGSYHHAAAINRALKEVKTRFVLILDNDFYIIRPDWIKKIIEHIKRNNLSFFGAPWHPRWWKKYRYFPTHYCLFIDLEKVDIKSLDFTPQYDERSYQNMMALMKGRLKDPILNRKLIGASRDTGYAIYQRYFKNNKKTRYESVLPVSKPYKNSIFLISLTKKIIKRILPDKLLYVPKKIGSYSEAGFSDLGFFDIAGQGWEEFMWQKAPFGFHLRGTSAKTKAIEPEEKIAIIRQALKSFL